MAGSTDCNLYISATHTQGRAVALVLLLLRSRHVRLLHSDGVVDGREDQEMEEVARPLTTCAAV